jgi:Fe-S oxidoreductase
MNPIMMALLIVGLVGAFAYSARRRYRLLKSGNETWESRFDRLKQRLMNVWTFAFVQKKMHYYSLAGLAHQFIFLGFVVLLLRTLVLWGRGFEPTFNLFVLGPEPVLGLPLGTIYNFLKDVFALLVLIGVLVFVYFRVIVRSKRMTLSGEGLVILGIIATMMIADLSYDGASLVLRERFAGECAAVADAWCQRAATLIAPLGPPQGAVGFIGVEPGGSLMSLALSPLGTSALVILAHIGFWLHSSLVLIFLNILPYTKHFHIITAIPNVALGDLTPRGRLRPLAPSTEALMAAVEKASENEDASRARIGYARIEHFPWKDYLDFYTCTECGRCSDNCPATKTGKLLSPKHFTLDLRNHLYQNEVALVGPKTEGKPDPGELVPHVIKPEVLWACTTCRACEEQCPVNITYVDKIVQMRRHLVTMKGEFPAELGKPFEGMEGNGNPWNLARVDRSAWTEGLEIKRFADKPDAEVLFWVGCAASYDDRAKKIARATVRLLQAAGVDFAILADEESCTGDPARRAGNEYLYGMLAEANVATLNGYKEQGGLKQIITTCPHCFNTLANEYPDFGGQYSVVHSADYLLGLLAEKKLVPKKAVRAKVAYHDSCYLGRYNDIYESPREILRLIEGVELVEVEHWNKKRGLCCGAGGAQMFMEEQNNDRVNVKRTLQLLDTGAQTIASACPFCMTMLKDGVKAHNKEDTIQNLDVVELLAVACGLSDAPKAGGESAAAAE